MCALPSHYIVRIRLSGKRIVPTSYDDFLPKLADWARRYLLTFGNRRHHLTFRVRNALGRE